MSWSVLSLNSPTSTSALNVSQTVDVFSISPWSFGVAEQGDDHSWLSFPNAVEAAIARVPANAPAVFALAVSASSLKGLADALANLAAVLPITQLQAAQRQAATRADLPLTKLTLIEPAQALGKAPLNQLKTINEQRKKALSVAALANAQALNGVNPLADLQAFAADKAAADAAVNATLPALSGGNGWRFYATGDFANALRTGHPASDQSLTVMLVVVGAAADLAYLNEMII
ncbi:MAG: hypothetical protein JKY51_00720 [Opitutaceae bacterium]|nr:hypothetical protein [Opitutaceae bacterium]